MHWCLVLSEMQCCTVLLELGSVPMAMNGQIASRATIGRGNTTWRTWRSLNWDMRTLQWLHVTCILAWINLGYFQICRAILSLLSEIQPGREHLLFQHFLYSRICTSAQGIWTSSSRVRTYLVLTGRPSCVLGDNTAGMPWPSSEMATGVMVPRTCIREPYFSPIQAQGAWELELERDIQRMRSAGNREFIRKTLSW